MKKKTLSLLSVLALTGSLLAGCGSSTSAPQSSAPQGQPADNKSAGQAEAQLEDTLVIAGNGATVEKLMKDVIFKKFNEKYPNVKLTYVSGVSTEIVAKVKAQKNSPQIDMTVIEGGEQEKGRQEGLWEAISEADIPNMKNVPDDLKIAENSGVTVNFTPMGISYNSELVKEKNLRVPASWNDLAKPEVKGYITMTDVASNFGRSAMIMMAYANGGSEKNIEPGFEKMKTIAGYMPTFAKSAAQLQQNLQNKSAAYTTWTMARSLTQKDAGLPLEFVFPQEGGNIVPNVATLVKGAKHPNAAKAFIDFLLSDEVQTMYATELYYNPATAVKLPEDVAKQLEFDRSKVVNFDYDVIGKETASWLDRFNKEIAPITGK
ncbi:ABC transporter substrate-binding protein [Brevibacillus borstelensis]|uniref:ABC transporter substrate-binding protein n=1 Tax=Brevibacillus borstelensis TaxID=45462 RepID=UPI00148F5EC1|nr:ABC transporter substrate-binding protein [Brevibacillus borstelensis]MBE5398375.1 ABC transporter substrate-binding protein [Brevibacillus borstelensis]MED1743692.1 ABC transporter substrate-binding protein [Brevibacillus borstelensis]NOU53600.1 ABC transporter substrate-binding protein [Brevibacillus borstelensis]